METISVLHWAQIPLQNKSYKSYQIAEVTKHSLTIGSLQNLGVAGKRQKNIIINITDPDQWRDFEVILFLRTVGSFEEKLLTREGVNLKTGTLSKQT